jgi:hypothetical protein
VKITYQVAGPDHAGRFLVFYEVAGQRTVVTDCATYNQAQGAAKRLNDEARARKRKATQEHERAEFYRIRFKNDRGGR